MIRVVATLVAQPGKEEALKQALLPLIDATRQEAGCIAYELHQPLGSATDFVFIETWADQAALESHGKTPHIQQFRALAKELLAAPMQISFLSKIY